MSEVDLVGDARSPAGHAAFSMRGTDDRWVMIQLNTFSNWVNEQLRPVGHTVEDMQTDFCDGIKLAALMEVLQNRRIGRIVKKPINQHQYLENVTLALRAMVSDNIKLVNIGSEDIVNGNLKLILGMFWHLILRYQIGKASKVPPKKLMISWLNAVMPDCHIGNFNTDWNDGITLHALIEYCKPGVCPDWRNLSKSDGLKNCRAAMDLAKEHFGIPLVLSPENLSSPDLDELSGMTYLSYFMKVDSPGYNATLKWVREQIPARNIKNFQKEWNDGQALADLVRGLGGTVNVTNPSDHEKTLQEGMDGARGISVEPVISAKEMADPEVDHLGVMAYTAWFQRHSPNRVAPPAAAPEPHVYVPPAPVAPPPRIAIAPAKAVTLTQFMRETQPANITTFTVEMLDDSVHKTDVKVEVIGPSTKPPVTLSWHGSTGHGHFTPVEGGNHQIMVYNAGEVVDGCPKDVFVKGDTKSVTLLTPLQPRYAINVSHEIKINSSQVATGNVRVEARSPSGRVMDMGVVDNAGAYTANFTPSEVGDWMISILYEGQHIQGSPFNVRVYDAAQVKVFGLEGGSVGKTFSFSADCSAAGDGDLTVDINHNGRTVPAQIHEDAMRRGVYRVSFTPEGSGIYTIRVYFAGMEVTGSPYTLEIVDSSMVTATGEGLTNVEANRRATFIVNTHGATGGDIRVNVTSPRGQQVPSQIYNQGDGTFRVEYQSADVGEHLVDVQYFGREIKGSPFRVQVIDGSRISIHNLRNNAMVGRQVEFDIDAAQAGSGNLEIMVNDGTIPCSVQNRGNRQFHATFMPKDPIPHYIQMKFNGKEVPGSPWKVDVRGAVQATASGNGLQLVTVRQQAAIDVRVSGGYPETRVIANITSPTQRIVPTQVNDNHNGTFTVYYTPAEVGNYQIDLQADGNPVTGSPFTSKAYDPSAIVVSNVPNGIVGKSVEFTIDVTQAGEGQLEIMVNRGAVPNTVRMLRKGVFLVSFVPRDARAHLIEVKFNGEALPRCPISVPILDASRVTVQGEGIRQVAVNKFSSFHVNTQSAGDADLTVRVTSPTGRNVPVTVKKTPDGGHDVDYQINEVGTHRFDIEYAGQPVPGSPFMCKSFDSGKVKVMGITNGVVGKQAQFIVDVNNAGEGNMEISLTGNGRNIQNHVRQMGPGNFEVSYTPLEGAPHEALITFNGEHVPGSPFNFNIMDPSKVSAMGDGLQLVAAGNPTSFTIFAPGADARDLNVTITAPSGKLVQPRITDLGNGNFQIDYVPTEIGDHQVDIRYMDLPIPGSPYTARTWDPSAVIVSNIGPGRINKPYFFNIDASRAGAGNLEIICSVAGENVPNFVKSQGNARFEVSFTPQQPDTHIISVKFNGELAPGSPFFCWLVDGRKATASGDGIKHVPTHRPAFFNVHTAGVGEAELEVDVLSPGGRPVESKFQGNPEQGYRVEYTPIEVGRHRINVQYADIDISESPFFPQAYDAGLVRVGAIPDGIVGQPVTFEVDCSMAGEGTMTVDVRGQTSVAYPDIKPKGNGIFDVMFIPRENCPHNVIVTFNGDKVPGSPFICRLTDTKNIAINWDKIRNVPVNRPATFDLDPGGVPQGAINCQVTDPHGRELATRLSRQGNMLRIEFAPMAVGAHIVNVLFGTQPVGGSPYTCYCYDASRVLVTDVTPEGKVGEEMGFTVDTSEAGQGDIDTEVVCNGALVRTQRTMLDHSRHRYTFHPQTPMNHTLDVTFNYEKVIGCPMILKVLDPYSAITLTKPEMEPVAVDNMGWNIIQTQGSNISVQDLVITVTAPNADLVPAKIVQQPDGDYKVEYSSKYTGRHTVEILYAGQAIMGSPFYVEIYDPNKIRVEGMKNGYVGEAIGFDILRHEAGKAELGLTIMSPAGKNIPYEIAPTPRGEHVTYTPYEAGPHHIYITYGGLEVPGCPMNQNISDNSGSLNAFGDGLYKGEEDKQATFYVDTGGKRGDLLVHVEGPNSIAKCNIEPDQSNRYMVTYTPVEVGTFNIHIKWNGREIPGSPFHPLVVDPGRVLVVGGWQSLLDANNMMLLTVNEQKLIKFDCSSAGPGKLSGEVQGPSGVIPIEIQQQADGSYLLAFTPRTEGEHYLTIRWSDLLLPKSPFMGVAKGGKPSINHEKVVLTGRGLQEARIKEEAEFVIDGTDAGPGDPNVKLTGVKQDIDVIVSHLGGNKYRCIYVPQIAGAYLLNIMWSDRQVRGSPFKVNVTAQSDASKVVCTGEGLKMGIMGKEIKSVIDTRRAGPGELTAHCMGPHKVAYCELYDHRDGTFTLNIKPQEPGRHVLQVKYGGDHVPGSPYMLRVSGAPDASKVKVYGPGVEHGILATYQSRFITETRGAGAGQLTVRIRGPKGAFRVEMSRESQKDRTILCRYDPTEVGDYIIHVKWSGEHVPGSPFHVQIFDTQDELERFLTENPSQRGISTLQSSKSFDM